MEVIKITRHILPWKVYVKFEALEDDSVVYGRIFGDKIFWIEKGDLVTIALPKNLNLDVGDCMTFRRLVLYDQLKFNWRFK